MAYLDLRDLADELEELERLEELDATEQERLEALRELQGELFTDTLAEYAEHESAMIPEGEFAEYAEEFAYDVGYADHADNNPLHAYIDWEEWAEDLKSDYREVTFEGETYLMRAY
jgi:hypothetical protein